MTSINEIDVKCLANMPMILDVISTTTRKLELIFDEIYLQIDSQLSEIGLVVENEWTFGYYPFSLNVPKNKGRIQSLTPEFQILYEKTFYKKNGRNRDSFEISFGYIVDEQQNVIYFQLSDDSSEYINEAFAESMKSVLSEKWTFGQDDGNIYIEFKIDDTLSEDKILALSQDFISFILKPLLQ